MGVSNLLKQEGKWWQWRRSDVAAAVRVAHWLGRREEAFPLRDPYESKAGDEDASTGGSAKTARAAGAERR